MTQFLKSKSFRLIIAVTMSFGAGWLGRGAWVEQLPKEKEDSHHLKPFHNSAASDETPSRGERPSSMPNATPHRSGKPQIEQPAQELLAKASAITDDANHARYLRGLVAAWIRNDLSLSTELKDALLRRLEDGSFRRSNGIMSDAVELSALVAKLADPEIREAWKQAHASDPARSEIFSRFASADVVIVHPGHLLGAAAGWTPWERSRYRDRLLERWASRNPDGARAWLESIPGGFGTAAARTVYEQLASTDFSSLEGELDSIGEPRLREVAIRALASSLTSNTRDAVEWADSLGSAADRDLAHEVIYDSTPRGIGVAIQSVDGFAVVNHVRRNNIGLQPGDRIVSIAEAGGETIDLFARALSSVAESIRGEPGTEATLNILRPREGIGALEQIELRIPREQLFFDGEPQVPDRIESERSFDEPQIDE